MKYLGSEISFDSSRIKALGVFSPLSGRLLVSKMSERAGQERAGGRRDSEVDKGSYCCQERGRRFIYQALRHLENWLRCRQMRWGLAKTGGHQ